MGIIYSRQSPGGKSKSYCSTQFFFLLYIAPGESVEGGCGGGGAYYAIQLEWT